MFDQHEVLLAEGVPTESFFPGDYILQDPDLCDEVMAVFPEMIGHAGPDWHTARSVLKKHEAAMFCGDRLMHA